MSDEDELYSDTMSQSLEFTRDWDTRNQTARDRLDALVKDVLNASQIFDEEDPVPQQTSNKTTTDPLLELSFAPGLHYPPALGRRDLPPPKTTHNTVQSPMFFAERVAGSPVQPFGSTASPVRSGAFSGESERILEQSFFEPFLPPSDSIRMDQTMTVDITLQPVSIRDTQASPQQPEEETLRRMLEGSLRSDRVLCGGMVLKQDTVHINAPTQEGTRFVGIPVARRSSWVNTYRIGYADLGGMSTLLNFMRAESEGSSPQTILWYNLRRVPVLYVNEQPYVMGTADKHQQAPKQRTTTQNNDTMEAPEVLPQKRRPRTILSDAVVVEPYDIPDATTEQLENLEEKLRRDVQEDSQERGGNVRVFIPAHSGHRCVPRLTAVRYYNFQESSGIKGKRSPYHQQTQGTTLPIQHNLMPSREAVECAAARVDVNLEYHRVGLTGPVLSLELCEELGQLASRRHVTGVVIDAPPGLAHAGMMFLLVTLTRQLEKKSLMDRFEAGPESGLRQSTNSLLQLVKRLCRIIPNGFLAESHVAAAAQGLYGSSRYYTKSIESASSTGMVYYGTHLASQYALLIAYCAFYLNTRCQDRLMEAPNSKGGSSIRRTSFSLPRRTSASPIASETFSSWLHSQSDFVPIWSLLLSSSSPGMAKGASILTPPTSTSSALSKQIQSHRQSLIYHLRSSFARDSTEDASLPRRSTTMSKRSINVTQDEEGSVAFSHKARSNSADIQHLDYSSSKTGEESDDDDLFLLSTFILVRWASLPLHGHVDGKAISQLGFKQSSMTSTTEPQQREESATSVLSPATTTAPASIMDEDLHLNDSIRKRSNVRGRRPRGQLFCEDYLPRAAIGFKSFVEQQEAMNSSSPSASSHVRKPLIHLLHTSNEVCVIIKGEVYALGWCQADESNDVKRIDRIRYLTAQSKEQLEQLEQRLCTEIQTRQAAQSKTLPVYVLGITSEPLAHSLLSSSSISLQSSTVVTPVQPKDLILGDDMDDEPASMSTTQHSFSSLTTTATSRSVGTRSPLLFFINHNKTTATAATAPRFCLEVHYLSVDTEDVMTPATFWQSQFGSQNFSYSRLPLAAHSFQASDNSLFVEYCVKDLIPFVSRRTSLQSRPAPPPPPSSSLLSASITTAMPPSSPTRETEGGRRNLFSQQRQQRPSNPHISIALPSSSTTTTQQQPVRRYRFSQQRQQPKPARRRLSSHSPNPAPPLPWYQQQQLARRRLSSHSPNPVPPVPLHYQQPRQRYANPTVSPPLRKPSFPSRGTDSTGIPYVVVFDLACERAIMASNMVAMCLLLASVPDPLDQLKSVKQSGRITLDPSLQRTSLVHVLQRVIHLPLDQLRRELSGHHLNNHENRSTSCEQSKDDDDGEEIRSPSPEEADVLELLSATRLSQALAAGQLLHLVSVVSHLISPEPSTRLVDSVQRISQRLLRLGSGPSRLHMQQLAVSNAMRHLSILLASVYCASSVSPSASVSSGNGSLLVLGQRSRRQSSMFFAASPHGSSLSLVPAPTFDLWLTSHPIVETITTELLHSSAAALACVASYDLDEDPVMPSSTFEPGLALSSMVSGATEDDSSSPPGAVLSRNFGLKQDHFTGCHRIPPSSLAPRLEGAPNFRRLKYVNVYGVATPSLDGFKRVLHLLRWLKGAQQQISSPAIPGLLEDVEDVEALRTARPHLHFIYRENLLGNSLLMSGSFRRKQKMSSMQMATSHLHARSLVLWINLREEPVLYVDRLPFVYRNMTDPYRNLQYPGITAETIDVIEQTLREDCLGEAQRHGNRFRVYRESLTHAWTVEPVWVPCDNDRSCFKTFTEMLSQVAEPMQQERSQPWTSPKQATVVTPWKDETITPAKPSPSPITGQRQSDSDSFSSRTALWKKTSPLSIRKRRSTVIPFQLLTILRPLTLELHRLPVTDEQTPSPLIFDTLVSLLLPRIVSVISKTSPETPVTSLSIVFNCQLGRGRTTTAMIIASMLVGLVEPGYYDWLRRDQLAELCSSHLVSETAASLPHEPGCADASTKRPSQWARGKYPAVMQVLALLKHGAQAKERTDLAVDSCCAMQNIRTVIESYKQSAEDLSLTREKRHHFKTVAEQYLNRYIQLIIFNEYLHQCCWSRTASEYDTKLQYTQSETFDSWLSSRPALRYYDVQIVSTKSQQSLRKK